MLFSDNIFLTSWRIFTKSSRDLFDKPRKRNRSKLPKEGIKELIIDKISGFFKELSLPWSSASSHVMGIGCQMPKGVFLINVALIN